MYAAALKSNNGETFPSTSFTPSQNAPIAPNTYCEFATEWEANEPSEVGIINGSCLDSAVKPWLKISVQPCDEFRFRYNSEKGSHGKLHGPAKNKEKNNFPTVKVHNLKEPHDNVEIRASLYTDDNKRPHVLEFVGKNCMNGVCTEKLSKNNTAIFRFLEIENKKKKEALDIVMKEKESLWGNSCDKEKIKTLALEDMKQLNMNCAKICFEAFRDNVSICEKVFSNPIKNSKSPFSKLEITCISSCSGSWKGEDDIILLCEKINKDDIEIHFYEKDENSGEILWKENGYFRPKDVHHQVAIPFKTPPYKNETGGKVQMKLYRRSDQQSSNSIDYTYIKDIDYLRHPKKRKSDSAESVELHNSNLTSSSPVRVLYHSLSSSIPELNQASSSSIPKVNQVSSSSVPELNQDSTSSVSNSNQASTSFVSNSNQASTSFVSNSKQASTSIVSNSNQASTSSFSHLGSWSLNTSVVGAGDASLGNSGTSSNEKNIAQFPDEDSKQPINKDFVDNNNFISNLGSKENTPSKEYSYEMPMDIEPLGFDSYETQEHIFSPYPAVDNNETMPTIFDNVQFRHCSSDMGIFAILAGLSYLASIGSSNLWNATIGRAVSYTRPSPSNNKRDTKTPSNTFVAKGEMANPTIKAPQSAEDQIFAQSALVFDMKNLSIQEDNQKDFKPFVSLPVTNTKSPFNNFDKTFFTNASSYDIKDTMKNVEGIIKASETNKTFDSFKKGVTKIMKRRRKDVYLHYISRLLSVKDENGNSFIHLAVLEQSENLNLMARILKIAPHIVNEQNEFKETPLHLATQKNASKMAFLLLAQGGNPSIVDVNGNNCFHIASKSNYATSMKFLLLPSLREGKHIPSIDDFNYDGFAPLHLSVMNNAEECMQLLLKAGADVNINDRKSGCSPLHLAIKQQSTLASDLLSHPDIDLSNADFNGHSIVHALCVMKGQPMPVIHKFTDFVDWMHKTLALPSRDSDESSCADSSSNSDSDEEVVNQHETEATPSFTYSRNFQSQGINGVKENVNSLSEECEKVLCKYLDADGGWKKLGLFVELDEKTLNGASKLSKNSSPSKLILRKVKKLYQKWDKQTLINILTAADLENVAEILRNERF